MTDGTVRGTTGVKIGGIMLHRLFYRIDETSSILGIPETKVREELDNGRLIAGCPNGVKKKPVMITTASIIDYYNIILIPKERWTE